MSRNRGGFSRRHSTGKAASMFFGLALMVMIMILLTEAMESLPDWIQELRSEVLSQQQQGRPVPVSVRQAAPRDWGPPPTYITVNEGDGTEAMPLTEEEVRSVLNAHRKSRSRNTKKYIIVDTGGGKTLVFPAGEGN